MFRKVAVLTILALVLTTGRSWAAGLSAQEKEFFDKHLSDVIKIEPVRLSDAAIVKVFAAPFYKVSIKMMEGDAVQTMEMIVTRVGDSLASVSQPGTDTELPNFTKMLNPDFRLKADGDAQTLQSALDALYPIISSGDKKLEKFRHSGNQWIFIRGKFFDDEDGYILQTNDQGAVTAAKFVLKLPK